MYTNAWQDYAGDDSETNLPVVAGAGRLLGGYPSGGDGVNVLDIWQYFAPTLDFITPDIYLNNYAVVCAKYRYRKQPHFIPEQRRGEYGARRIWIAIGSYQALETAPFGLDTLDIHENPFRKHCNLLATASPFLLAARQTPDSSIGFCFDELASTGKDSLRAITAVFGKCQLQIERPFVFGQPGPGFGIVLLQATPHSYSLVMAFKSPFPLQIQGKYLLRFLDSSKGKLSTRRQGKCGYGGHLAAMRREVDSQQRCQHQTL
jgi:hypothetical protein